MNQIGPILRAMKHNRTRVVLIVLEIAVTLAIVTNCVNVILAERRRMATPSGLDDDHLLRVTTMPFSPEFKKMEVIDATIASDVRILAGIPGVRSAANANVPAWEGGGSSTGVKVVGQSMEPTGTQIYFGTKDVMDTLGVKIIEGRAFREEDYPPTGDAEARPRFAIISKALADSLFPDGHAVGKAIHEANDANSVADHPMTVVGVIERFYNPWGMFGRDPGLSERVMIEPSGVGGYEGGTDYYIRTEPGVDPTSIVGEVEKRLSAASPGRVFEFLTIEEKRNRWFDGSKIVVTTMSCIIVALIAVTSLGLLGLTSLSVAERRKQIGTRRALGATRGDIVAHLLVENWLVTSAGLALGIAGAVVLNMYLVARVSDTKLPWELVAGGMVLLWINGLVSTLPAALKATLVPPWIATRSV